MCGSEDTDALALEPAVWGKRSNVTHFSLKTGKNVHISTLITCRQIR